MVQSTLELPFFDDGHRALSAAAEAFVESLPTARHGDSQAEVDQACRDHVKSLGGAGLLRYCVRGIDGGALAELDSRSLCILRQRFAHHDALLDFAFAMQGLGSGALSLAGESALRAAYLPRVARGQAIAAFALSEPNAGSDVAALECRAFFDAADGCYVLDGEKTFISNGGIADFYTVFARTGEAPGARGLTAFVVDAESNGLRIAERIEVALVFRGLSCALDASPRRAGWRLQAFDDDPRHLPHVGRGGGLGARPQGCRRGLPPRRVAPDVRGHARGLAGRAVELG